MRASLAVVTSDGQCIIIILYTGRVQSSDSVAEHVPTAEVFSSLDGWKSNVIQKYDDDNMFN